MVIFFWIGLNLDGLNESQKYGVYNLLGKRNLVESIAYNKYLLVAVMTLRHYINGVPMG